MICCYDKLELPSSNVASVINVNEYSKLKNNTDSSKCFNFVKHSEYAVEKSATEYSKVLLSNQVSKTRLEFKHTKNTSRNASEKISVLNYVITGGNKMAKRIIDFDSEMDQIIDRIVRVGESRSSAVKRALSYVDKDSNFYNLE